MRSDGTPARNKRKLSWGEPSLSMLPKRYLT